MFAEGKISGILQNLRVYNIPIERKDGELSPWFH